MKRIVGLADGTRLVVARGGGRPLVDEEIVAIAVALDTAVRNGGPSAPKPSAWLRAARFEGVTASAIASPAQLRGAVRGMPAPTAPR